MIEERKIKFFFPLPRLIKLILKNFKSMKKITRKLDPTLKKSTAAIDAAAKAVHTVEKQRKDKKININVTTSFYEELKAFSDETGIDMTAVLTIGGSKFMRDYRS